MPSKSEGQVSPAHSTKGTTTKFSKADLAARRGGPQVGGNPDAGNQVVVARRPRPSSSASLARPEQPLVQRHALIARAAYLRAIDRGFTAGHDLEDWFVAEAEIDRTFDFV